jgi:hypothetical protein
VTDIEGRPFHPDDRSILASNGRVHAEMQQLAADVAERAAATK